MSDYLEVFMVVGTEGRDPPPETVTRKTERPEETPRPSTLNLGSFPLTVTVTTMGYRSYKNPPNKAPLRTVTGRGNDPT